MGSDTLVEVRVEQNTVYASKAFKMHVLGNAVDNESEWIDMSELQHRVDTTLEPDAQEAANDSLFALLQAAALMPEMHIPARNTVITKTHQMCSQMRKQNSVLKRSFCGKDTVERRALTVLAARQPERKRQRK
jgi:hypothetical protein